MRTALLRPALPALLLSFACPLALAAQGSTASHKTPARPAASSAPQDRGSSAAEEARYYSRAQGLRERILEAAEWSGFDDVACNPGALRIFPKDSAAHPGTTALDDIEQLERIIIARGIDSSFDTPSGHELLDTVIGWEAASTRPLWDVLKGGPVKKAVATGLSGEYLDPVTKKCEPYVPYDSVTVIIPVVTHYTPPDLAAVKLNVRMGEAGLKQARDLYHAAHANIPSAIFNYIRIRAVVVWRDFAVVGVNRPAELRGIQRLDKGAGGAAYMFHRVDGKWKLLAITRTWS